MDVRLVYFGQNGQRREVHLHEGLVSVGRAEECQLRIPADTVSRRHCQIEISGKEIVLTDMGSSNGTVVNDKKVVDDDVILQAGDKITVGPATFTLLIDGKPGKGTKALPAKAEPTVNKEVEEALSGSSLADETFDPLSMLEEITPVDDDEDEDDDAIPPQPKQAVIPRNNPSDAEKKGPGGGPLADKKPPEKPGSKGKP
jgi:pSer/pThr/pTyr-binding forkhead associated (FHA) protein